MAKQREPKPKMNIKLSVIKSIDRNECKNMRSTVYTNEKLRKIIKQRICNAKAENTQ